MIRDVFVEHEPSTGRCPRLNIPNREQEVALAMLISV